MRCVCDLNKLASFRPTAIVTLIDDVYMQWWRTEARAFGESHRGRPTLEQLIMARRTEQLLGDMLAHHASGHPRHLVLAISHPIRTLASFIFTAKKVVYLSFPISAPRDLAAEGDRSGIDAINEFHASVYSAQMSSPDLAFVSPLGIDELPLLAAYEQQLAAQGLPTLKKKGVCFGLNLRWNHDKIFPDVQTLQCPVSESERKRPLKQEEVEKASGLIWTDVSWRDTRLVMQADAVAVYCPIMRKSTISRGVLNEVESAYSGITPCYVYQDPRFGSSTLFDEWLGKPGTMGESVKQVWVTQVDSVEQMINKLKR